MMKKVKINYTVIESWESWYAAVPDDAPDDTDELLEWIENNPDKVEFTTLEDSGNYGMEPNDVEVMES